MYGTKVKTHLSEYAYILCHKNHDHNHTLAHHDVCPRKVTCLHHARKHRILNYSFPMESEVLRVKHGISINLNQLQFIFIVDI